MTTISVVTAVYNRKKTVGEALESLFSQRYTGWESVVIDGGSTDGTLDVLQRFRSRISVLISEPDRGIYDALNKGIRASTGDAIGFLHADDALASDRVLGLIAEKFADPSVEAVYGDLVYVRESDTAHVVRHWRAGEYSRSKLARGWMPPHPTFYVRRSVYQQLGDFDTRYRIAADYDTVVRFLGRGNIMPHYIPEVLVRMRTGGVSNRSASTILCKSREDYAVVRENRIGGLSTLLLKNLSKLGQFIPG